MKLEYSPERKLFILKEVTKENAWASEHIRKHFDHLPTREIFTTRNLNAAAFFFDYANGPTKNYLNRKLIIKTPWEGGKLYQYHPENLSLKPYQKLPVLWALTRNKSYLALDPGLGKTIAAMVANNYRAHKNPKSVFYYITPPFLNRNVKNEFALWNTHGCGFLVANDSLIANNKKELMETVGGYKKQGFEIHFTVDEAHRFKNETSKRTKALFGETVRQKGKLVRTSGLLDFADSTTYLSGTPMPNGRPMELWPVLKHSAYDQINFINRFDYGVKYCGGYDTGFGWDFNGSSNLDDLIRKLKSKFMLRLKKDELDLPPKLESTIILPDEMPKALKELDSNLQGLVKDTAPEDIEAHLAAHAGKQSIHLATYRKLLGLYKAPFTVDFVKDILEETNESVLVFAIHKEAIETLTKGLEKYNPLVVTGATPMGLRHEYVKTFQNEPSRRVFIGNIQSCGVGFTLTKATRVVFSEFSWVPGENEQASDRAHRIGQNNPVLVQYLIFETSLDGKVVAGLNRKSKVGKQL